MPKTVMLSPVQHLNVKVDHHYDELFGDSVMWTLTFPDEFRHLQSEYPILFRKNELTGDYFPVVLFGLEAGENLFLIEGNKWRVPYVPLVIQKGPFSIGLYGENEGDNLHPLIHIDLDHPKVNLESGTFLFESSGEPSEYLKKISCLLKTIHDWHPKSEKFIKLLMELELMEAASIDVKLRDGTAGQLLGFYIINEDKISELSGDQVSLLNESGFLLPIFMSIASLSNISKLAEIKLERKKRTFKII